jgi:hypothetical protein
MPAMYSAMQAIFTGSVRRITVEAAQAKMPDTVLIPGILGLNG